MHYLFRYLPKDSKEPSVCRMPYVIRDGRLTTKDSNYLPANRKTASADVVERHGVFARH